MKIKLLDEVLKHDHLDINKEYEVVRVEYEIDDMYYIVKNQLNKEIAIHELLAKEI